MQGIIEAVDLSHYLGAVVNLGPSFFVIAFMVVGLEYINAQIKGREREKKAKIRSDNAAYRAHVRRKRKTQNGSKRRKKRKRNDNVIQVYRPQDNN